MSLIVVINGVDDLANAEVVEKKTQETFFSEYFYNPIVVAYDFMSNDDGGVSAGFLLDRAKSIVYELHKLFRQKRIEGYRLVVFFAHNTGAALVKQILLYSIESIEYGWIARQTVGMHFIEAQSYTNRTQWEKYLFRLLAVKRLPVSDLAAIAHDLPDQLARVQMQFSSIASGFKILVTNRSSGVYLRSEDPWYFGQDRSKQSELVEAVESMIAPLRCNFMRVDAKFKEMYMVLCRPEAVSGRINASFVDPESMTWVKSHDEYKKWHDSKDSGLLAITGPSGSGKASVASHILYTLQTENLDPEVLFLSFSFSRWDISRNSEWDLVASLIRQLLFLKPSIVGRILRMLDLIVIKERISKSYLWGFFQHLCSVSGLSTIFLVIDTVDQCREPISDRILSLLANTQITTSLKILTTGFDVADAAANFSVRCLSLENMDWSASIRNVARERVSRIVRKRLVWRDKQEELVEKICDANANYLCTMTNLDLLEYSTIPSTKAALKERLRSPFLSIEEVFDIFLKTVHESTSATLALHWIYHSLRPFTLSELSVALALSLDPEKYATKTATFEELADQVSWDLMKDLGAYLGQVVKIVDDRAILVHHAFYSHLEKQDHLKTTDFHVLAAKSCISYINLCSEEAADEKIKNARLSRSTIGVASSLLEYAQLYWAHHYELVQGIDTTLDNTVLEFLSSSVAADLSDTEFGVESTDPENQDAENGNSSEPEADADPKDELGDDAADKDGDGGDDGDDDGPKTGEEMSPPVIVIPQSPTASLHVFAPSISSGSVASSASVDSGFGHFLPPSKGWAILCRSLYGWPEMTVHGPIFLSIQLGLGHITQVMLRDIGDTTESDKRRVQNSIAMAAFKRDMPLLDTLLEKRQKSDHPNSSLKNAMSLAVESGNVNILKRILEAAADTPEFEDLKRGVGTRHPLLIAARCGFTEIVELLLTKGFNLLMTSRGGFTAVTLACQLGDVKTLKVMQRLQSEKFQETLVMACNEDQVPLQYVCMSGIVEAFDFITKFAPPEQLTQTKEETYTPAQLCAIYGHTVLLDRLIEAGVDILVGTPCPLPDVFSYDDSVGHRDWNEVQHTTALEFAVRGNKEDCAIRILDELSKSEEGKEISEAEAERRKAMLDSALFEAVTGSRLRILELLLQKTKRDPVIDAKHVRICCGRGHLQALKMLMAAGISIKVFDGEYSPYLDLAISEVNLDVVRFLIDNGLRSEWDGNETSIQYAARRGYIVALRLMLKASASDPEHILRESAANLTAHQLSASACQVEAFKELWAWEQEYLKKVNESGQDSHDSHDSHDSRDSHDERSESSASPLPEQIQIRRPAWALNLAITGNEYRESKIKFIEYLFDEGWDPNIPDKDVLPLHSAIRWHEAEIVQMLLDNGADPNATNQRGETAVYVAASTASEDVILRLLDKGGDINMRAEDECAPIHVAVSRRDDFVVRVLLGLDRPDGTALPVANAAALGIENKTPLHLAVDTRPVARSLLEAREKLGAQIDLEAVDIYGKTPLIEATSSGVDEVIMLLLEHGANPNARDKQNQTPLHYLGYETFTRFGDETGLALIRSFYEHGADVNAVGGTFGPLLCAYIWDFRGYMQYIKLLLELGASAKYDGLAFGTPLHLVVHAATELESAAGEFIPLMVEHGADVNAVDKYGRTVLLYCALKEREPVVFTTLLQLHADPNIADHLGATPLHYAVAIPALEGLVSQLFEAGARVDGLDNCGRSVLYKALLTSDEQSSASFDTVLAHIPEADRASQMAAVLPAAAKARNEAVVRRILDVVGADVNAVDRSGWTALDIAECYGATDMIRMLTERGARKGTDIKTPTRMSDSDRKGDIIVSEDGTEVSMAEIEARHYYDESNSASVRADHCIPPDQGIFYFEVEILECGANCGIAVGLTQENLLPTEMAGWRTGSWGYHNDDGWLLHNDSPVDMGPSFNTGSVVGVSYDPETQKLWFSVEGVPVACKSWAEKKPEEEKEEKGEEEEEEENKKEEEKKEDEEEDNEGNENKAESEPQTPIPAIGQLYPTVSFQQPWISALRARVNFGPQHVGGQPFRYELPTAVPS